MKKKKACDKKSLKKQLIGGTVYVALAAVVAAVTLHATVGMISDKTKDINLDETLNLPSVDLPSVPKTPSLNLSQGEVENKNNLSDSAVGDIADGISALIEENAKRLEEDNAKIEETESVDVEKGTISGENLSLEIPESANLGLEKFIKPCSGFVSKSHSTLVPVYSPTMSDYRTHTGVDVAESVGTEIVCVNGGIVTDIYNDDLFGKTVKMKNKEGFTIVYSNLLETLSDGVEVGAILKTGDSLGGIGESAICEAVEAPHVHLEIYNAEGVALDPEELIDF